MTEIVHDERPTPLRGRDPCVAGGVRRSLQRRLRRFTDDVTHTAATEIWAEAVDR